MEKKACEDTWNSLHLLSKLCVRIAWNWSNSLQKDGQAKDIVLSGRQKITTRQRLLLWRHRICNPALHNVSKEHVTHLFNFHLRYAFCYKHHFNIIIILNAKFGRQLQNVIFFNSLYSIKGNITPWLFNEYTDYTQYQLSVGIYDYILLFWRPFWSFSRTHVSTGADINWFYTCPLEHGQWSWSLIRVLRCANICCDTEHRLISMAFTWKVEFLAKIDQPWSLVAS